MALLASLAGTASTAGAQTTSLRDQFNAQQQPKVATYPEGFMSAIDDMRSTWQNITRDAQHFLIIKKPPRRTLDGMGLIYDHEFESRKLFSVFVLDDLVFEPVYGSINTRDNNFIWKGASYQCTSNCFKCYTLPNPLGRIQTDGFATFDSAFLRDEAAIREAGDRWTLQEFEVNFKTRECFTKTRGRVERCHVVTFDEYLGARRTPVDTQNVVDRNARKMRELLNTSELTKACRVRQ